MHGYLDAVTPPQVVNKQTGQVITDFSRFDENAILKPGDFSYAGYTNRRLDFLAAVAPYFQKGLIANPETPSPLRQVLAPHALDDAGAMAAAAIKTTRSGGLKSNLRPLIDRYLDYYDKRIPPARSHPGPQRSPAQHPLARRPVHNRAGSGSDGQTHRRYYEDAVRQVKQYGARMFNPETRLFMYGWVQGNSVHPEFRWARANGWAIMTMVELLDVLPADHPGRGKVLQLLKSHAKGLATHQSGSGSWHQFLDRPDSYLETSATAIYVYSLAWAVNRAYIDPLA